MRATPTIYSAQEYAEIAGTCAAQVNVQVEKPVLLNYEKPKSENTNK